MFQQQNTYTLFCERCFSSWMLKQTHCCLFNFSGAKHLHCVVFAVSVAEHLQVQHSAIKMLHSRIKLILQYISAVEKGELLYLFCLRIFGCFFWIRYAMISVWLAMESSVHPWFSFLSSQFLFLLCSLSFTVLVLFEIF